VLDSPSLRFAFASDGRPASIEAQPAGAELMNLRDPGQGFYLSTPGGPHLPLTNMFVRADGRLVARSASGAQEVIFNLHAAAKYLALRIEHLKGIPASASISLHFQANADPSVRVMDLDYMTWAHNDPGGVRVDWPYLWQLNPADPLGVFALYIKKIDADEDDTLLHIWVDERLPHPAVPGEWTLDSAREWVANWQHEFVDRSQMIVEGNSLQDLYDVVPYAEKAKIKQIYLFTNTWRTDAFWPMTDTSWGVNRKVFPRGETDLRAYSEYLKQHGIRLGLHYVSGGIGLYDPLYVGSKPDHRLASWGQGQTAEAISATARDILFRPAPGVELPYQLPQGQPALLDRLPELPSYFEFNVVRIEDELVKVGSFEHTDTGAWLLKDCQRGLYNTKAVAHIAGADAAGLLVAYGQNFVPDNDSTLLGEVAAHYAGLINRCNIDHTEYDGAEIHCYDGDWG
jgi:hypothetical protein